MTDLRDAARQALNSLRGYRRELGCQQPCDAERALETALEQPEQEPVAWMDPNRGEVCRAHWLESHAPERDVDRFSCPLYTHPPRREWRGLTEEDRSVLFSTHFNFAYQLVNAIEDALKERNA
jgi:hypothetical protein